jgi:protein ImuB
VPRTWRSRHAPSATLFGRDPPPRSGEELVVTQMREGSKILIATASPAARALGLSPGMAVTQARAQIPGVIVLPADPAGDLAALEQLAIVAARRWSPLTALSGLDGLFIDITATAHLFGGEAKMARRIVRLLARRGFTARIAVADTAGAAWALAHYGPTKGGIAICSAGAQDEALAGLPIAALRTEPAAIELLRRLGVERIGQLTAMPRAPLTRRFGTALIARLDQALGRRDEPLDPVIPVEPILVVQRFAEPIATAEAIEHWLGILMPQLVTALAEAGLGARLVELVADRIDGMPQQLRIGLARPTRDPAHLLRLMVRRIEEIAPGFGIDALALHVRRADPLGAQPFAERLEDRSLDLAPLVDALANRIGDRRLWRSQPVESDVPERSVACLPPLDPPVQDAITLKADDVRQLDRSPDLHPWHHRWPRPVRLLRRPEQLDHVIAELPDQPPRRFSWRGEMHKVVRADGPERVQGEWWKRTAEQHAVRDYFQVENEAGQRFWLFRRGDGERTQTGDLAWFMHGAFG